jgi:predicted  nucleic acid-binding Zn-ribbon protein
LKGVKTQ